MSHTAEVETLRADELLSTEKEQHQSKEIWCCLCSWKASDYCYNVAVAVYNAHIEYIARCKRSSPGRKPAIFHPGCPVSVPVAPLRAPATRHLWRGNVMMPDCCITSLSRLFQQPKKLPLQMNGPQRDWEHERRRNGWALVQRPM